MSSFSFKHDVLIKRVHPEMVYAWGVVAQLSAEWGINTVVTSVSDGVHSANSKHYCDPCQATDFRTWYLPSEQEKRRFARELQRLLGKDFDVVLESTHLHVEYDP